MADTPKRIPPIPQSPVLGTEKTTPTLDVIRGLLASKIPTTGVTPEKVVYWLQAPPWGSSGKSADSRCDIRGPALAKELLPSGVASAPGAREFKTSTAYSSLASQWEGVDNLLKKAVPVMIKGRDQFVGGEKSVFNKGESFHVVLFLAYGKDDGKDFYVGYDPDISATDATRKAWDIAAQDNIDNAITNMILGTGVGGLGPLCRKYYVDKESLFPGLDRPGFNSTEKQ